MSEDVKQMPLGRIESKDERDAQYPMRAALPKRITAYREKPWKLGPVLDQGSTSSCVGHAWRAFLNAQPIRTKTGPDALTIYAGAQDIDEWPEKEPEMQGTSVRAGVQYLRSLGMIEQFVWADGAQTVADFVRTKGTVVAGTDWLSDMFWPDVRNGYLLDVSGPVAGGHSYDIVWFYKRVRLAGMTYRNIFKIQNSWGDWADGGFAYIRFEDLDRLLRNGGEACAALERRVI